MEIIVQIYVHRPLVIDITKFDSKDECIFALFEKTSEVLAKLTPFFYHKSGYCYENEYLNRVLEEKLPLEKTITPEDMKMDITRYTKENEYKEIIKNFEYLHGVTIDGKGLLENQTLEINEMGIVINNFNELTD